MLTPNSCISKLLGKGLRILEVSSCWQSGLGSQGCSQSVQLSPSHGSCAGADTVVHRALAPGASGAGAEAALWLLPSLIWLSVTDFVSAWSENWKVEGACGCSCTEVQPPLLEMGVWVLGGPRAVISVLSQEAQSQDLGVTTGLGPWFCKAEILSLLLLEAADILRVRCESWNELQTTGGIM